MKKLFLGVIMGAAVVGLTACGSDKKEDNKKEDTGRKTAFTISCEAKPEKENGMTQTSKAIYSFDKEQYVTEYEITMTSKFDKEETYKTYRDEAKEAEKTSNTSAISYKVTSDDKAKTLTIKYGIDLRKEDPKTQQDPDVYKAANVLEEHKKDATCKVEGIKESEIK